MPKYRGPKLNTQPHLIQQIVANAPPLINQETEPELPVMCQYGFLCSHLRAQGKCSHPHPRSHFLFLNLVPPFDCLEDPAQELLSKRQKKERKIVEKTINAEINVEELRKRQEAAKAIRKQQLKKQILAQVDGKERKILEIAGSETVEEFYKQLTELQTSETAEIKKRAMLQLRKKNQAIFKEAIEKQYRIANRLIKAAAKNPSSTLLEVYEDINHDTMETVREFFGKYFSNQAGIPLELGEQRIVLSKIFSGLFKSRPQEYSGSAYFSTIKETDQKDIKSNVELFNLMVPSALNKGIQFTKFYLFEGSNFSLSSVSNLLNQDHLKTFTAKSKNPPEFPFGQLPDNIRKFKLWASKINAKFSESKKEYKIIILITDLEFLVAQNLQQFEQEKQKERQQTLKALMQVFHPVFIFLSSSKDSKNEETVLGKLLTPLPEHPVLFEKLSLIK